MAEKLRRVKMLHGALGERGPKPEDIPQPLHIGGVYDVPEALAVQLIHSNFAVEVDPKEEKTRDGDPAGSPGWGPEHPEWEERATKREKAAFETRRPRVTTRDPAAKV